MTLQEIISLVRELRLSENNPNRKVGLHIEFKSYQSQINKTRMNIAEILAKTLKENNLGTIEQASDEIPIII